ncbi:MAG: hypothetical protein H6R46_1064 [Proteobacteria bacterium]|nr:hypothetical protein [Pseudomonadota bacterium]
MRKVRPTTCHARNETGIQTLGLGLQQAEIDTDTGFFEIGDALTRHARVGIGHGGHHTRNTGLDQRLAAGRGTAVMATGLQRHIGRRAARQLACCGKRMHLGMRFAGTPVPAFADYLPIAHNHAANTWIGIGGVETAFRQLQSARHVAYVIRRIAIFVQACFP